MASYLLYDYERESRLLDQRITVRREAHGRRWVGGRDGGRQKWGLVLRGAARGRRRLGGQRKSRGGIKTEVSSRTIGEERTHSVTSWQRGIDIFCPVFSPTHGQKFLVARSSGPAPRASLAPRLPHHRHLAPYPCYICYPRYCTKGARHSSRRRGSSSSSSP